MRNDEATIRRLRRLTTWSAMGAGVAALVGLLSTLPWPELYALDAVPQTAVALEPHLLPVLVSHYAILAVGGVLGSVAGVLLAWGLPRRRSALVAAMFVAVGAGTLGYAAAHRAIDVAMYDGRSTTDLAGWVWTGGGVLLVAVAALTWAVRHDAGAGFVILGFSAPTLVAAGLVLFTVAGPDLYPNVWGVTFPPPSDYLLAAWFIAVGQLVRTERLPRRQPA